MVSEKNDMDIIHTNSGGDHGLSNLGLIYIHFVSVGVLHAVTVTEITLQVPREEKCLSCHLFASLTIKLAPPLYTTRYHIEEIIIATVPKYLYDGEFRLHASHQSNLKAYRDRR